MMRNLIKKKTSSFEKIIASLMILIGIFLVIHSTYWFATHWHNIDLSYNVALTVNDLNQLFERDNMTLMDYRTDMVDWTGYGYLSYPHTYVIGSIGIRNYFFRGLLGAFLLGYGLSKLEEFAYRKND